MSAVDFFTNVIGEVKHRGSASWTKHAVVHGLNHPADLLGEIQFLRRGEGAVEDVKVSGCYTGIVGVQSCHVIAGVSLNEHAPAVDGRATTVGPTEGWQAVSHEGVRARIPNDGAVVWPGVHTAHGWSCDGSVFPNQRQVGALTGAPFGGSERDFVGGLT